MNRSTTLLVEGAAALDQLVDGMSWSGASDSLDELLSCAQDATLLDVVERTGRLSKLLDAVASRAAGEVAKRSARAVEEPLAKRLGERSAVVVVAHLAGVPVARAEDWCSLGERLAPRTSLTGEVLPSRYSTVADALDTGGIGADEARVILDALGRVEPHAAAEDVDAVEGFLVEQAAVLTIADLGSLCRVLPDRFNPDGVEPREDDLRERSGLRVTKRRDGLMRWVIDAHPEAAGFLTAALEARLSPRRQVRFLDDAVAADREGDDGRTVAQKRLEALIDMARDSLKGDDGDLSGNAVTMLVTVDHQTLVTGVGSATIFGIDEPIGAATARRLACEAEIIPIVLGGESEPLDLGHGRRLFSRSQRHAMAVRDGGCIWPGCDAPPSRCEAAHLEAWYAGGPTNLENGVLLCRFHHRRLDNDGWRIRIEHGVPYLIPPPWVDATQTPRRAGRRPTAA